MSEAKLKTISVTLLLSIIAVSAPVFSWVVSAERRMGVLEQSVKFLEQEQAREEKLRTELRKEIKDDLNSINDKLDRIIESKK